MNKHGIALASLLLVVAVLRLRFLDFPLTRDEGDYAYMAQLWLDGVPPYTAAYDMRFPGIFAFYALALSAFGQTGWGVHMALLVVHTASVWVVYALGRKLMGFSAGFVAAICFAALELNPWIHGTVANTEHFVLLSALGGLYVLLEGLDGERHSTIGAAGLLLGFAVLTKQNAALFVVFASILTAWRAPARLPALLIGATVPFASACALLAALGSFDSFWFWTMTYPTKYLTALPLEAAWFNFKARLPSVIRWTLGFWLVAAMGVVALIRSGRAAHDRVFLLGLLLFSFLALSSGFYFRPQHFQMMLPAIALLVGMAANAGGGWVEARRGRGAARATAAALVLIPLATFLWGEREFLFRMDGPSASRMIFGFNPFPESREIANYLAEHSGENDTVAIFGSEPQIYFYARRRSATPFTLVYEAMQPHEYAHSMQEEMIEALEEERPRHLVFVNVPNSWLASSKSDPLLFDWWKQNAQRNYRQVGQINILAETEYLWGEAVGEGKARSHFWISVWERKDAPSP